jgi:hypothetical protein
MGHHAYYITKEATAFNSKLNALKSTGSTAVMLGMWMILLVVRCRSLSNMELLGMLKYRIYFSRIKLFLFHSCLMPDFMLITMKIIYHLSFVMRKAPLSYWLYYNKIPFCNIPTCRIIFCNINSSLITHSEQSTVNNLLLTVFISSSVLPKCFILLFCSLVSKFHFLWGVCWDPVFSLLTFPHFFLVQL